MLNFASICINYSQMLDFEDKSFKAIFYDNMQPMWITNADANIFLEINSAAEKAYGYIKDEVFLQSVEKIILQKEQQKLQHLAQNTLSGNQQLKKEISLISKTGKLIYADAVVSIILYNGNEALLITLTDVSEKKLYRNMLEDAMELENQLKIRNKQLKDLAYFNFQSARKPLANILGLVNLLDQTMIGDKTLLQTIEFLRESGNQLDELIKGIEPQE